MCKWILYSKLCQEKSKEKHFRSSHILMYLEEENSYFLLPNTSRCVTTKYLTFVIKFSWFYYTITNCFKYYSAHFNALSVKCIHSQVSPHCINSLKNINSNLLCYSLTINGPVTQDMAYLDHWSLITVIRTAGINNCTISGAAVS
jgi:hypothetical protein